MNLLERIHESYVFDRRTAVLSSLIAPMFPASARVLDIGSGDGKLARSIIEKRPDVSIEGVDVLVRVDALIPVREYDGAHLPYESGSFDVVLLVDVLHHTVDPELLMREAVRVARGNLIIKDHTREGAFANTTLLFMDRVGNARHGVAIPANYWRKQRWRDAFNTLNFRVVSWTANIPLYPFWATWLFGRSLHFLAQLDVAA
jgi:SAM-dependent methyltransferase